MTFEYKIHRLVMADETATYPLQFRHAKHGGLRFIGLARDFTGMDLRDKGPLILEVRSEGDFWDEWSTGNDRYIKDEWEEFYLTYGRDGRLEMIILGNLDGNHHAYMIHSHLMRWIRESVDADYGYYRLYREIEA